jgi:hypothetical protein
LVKNRLDLCNLKQEDYLMDFKTVMSGWWQVVSELLQPGMKRSPLITAVKEPQRARPTHLYTTEYSTLHSTAHPTRMGISPLLTRHSPLFPASLWPHFLPHRLSFLVFLFASLAAAHLSLAAASFAQGDSASISGTIIDRQGGLVPDAKVSIVNTDTNVSLETKTNGAGVYNAPFLKPGHYRIVVTKQGFKQIDLRDVTLNVQDSVNRNFTLDVGATSETIQVNGNTVNINTTDATVSTVIDRQFVENMPLNGRSFQSLILLAPGVVTATPQNGAQQGYSGEYSVNGQRADANNFMVDGVSANNSPNPYGYSSAGNAGALPATTALGTTQAIISVDALQEFKIQTSTYSAEYGRQPGAQISFETRSGTNDWHGSAFDYLRNDIFDANNWFNDHTTPLTPKPAERQNDFGGTVGGPLGIPDLYSGKDRTFFFFSYEGLRLTQPQPAQVFYVPSTQLRQEAPPALQPVMNAFPLPNCSTANSSECIDPGNGLLPFLISTSLPSNLDAISARADERVAPWLNLFFRYSSTDSSSQQFADTFTGYLSTNTQTFTLGADSTISSNITNQFRLNYSSATASAPTDLASYGGAVPANLLALNDIQSSSGYIGFIIAFPGYQASVFTGKSFSKQHQWNLVETLAWSHSNHLFHAGIDYRRTSSVTAYVSPELEYLYTSTSNIAANAPEAEAVVAAAQYPEYTNFSAFFQDEWRLSRSVNLSLGLRWELNPPPTVTSGLGSRTVNGNFDDPASLTLAPAGTSLYGTTYHNFAPRVGIAAVLRNTPGLELVFRSGGGVFFDTGQQTNGIFGSGHSPGTGFSQFYPGSPANAFPFTAPLSIPIDSTLTPPYGTITMASQHLQLPYTLQWNASLEQALGKHQSISLGYIGSNGRRLLDQNSYNPANPLFTYIQVYQNGLSSSYNSLQVQYKRTLSRGLQALASYTWSHALDYESADYTLFPYQRGNSDFDVRNNLTGALSYNLPKEVGSHLTSVLLGGWGTDLRLTARSAFPVTLAGNYIIDPVTGQNTYGELNLVPDVPVYLYGAQYPGGRSINPAAFTIPPDNGPGNAPRNFARGFGETEVNFAVRREFPLGERLHLQFRAEAFNLFNHPNFGYIDPHYGDALFGQATQTLASSIGGLTSLYQQGGPRSLQFSLRLQF